MRSKIYLKKMQHTLLLALLLTAVLSVFGVPRAYAKAETDDLSVLEERCLVPVAILTEMTDGAFTFVSVKDLRGTDGAVAWFVVEGDPGYAVVAADGTIAELSAEAVSPYDGLSGDRLYYFGDGAYYVWENGAFLHIATGQTLSLADAEATLGVISGESVQTQSTIENAVSVTDLTFTDVSLENFAGYQNSPFYQLRSTTEFGKNRYGTCTAVAANMLLQYYSDRYCPGFLPCTDADFDALGWRGSREVSYGDDGDIVYASYESGDNLAEKRHKYIYNRIKANSIVPDYYGMGASVSNIYTGILDIFREGSRPSWNVTFYEDKTNTTIQDETKEQLIACLRVRPAIASIYTVSGISDGKTVYGGGHACIFYKSVTIGGKTYFLANMGHDANSWGGTFVQPLYATIVPEDYVQDAYLYMTPSDSAAEHRYTEAGNIGSVNGYHAWECADCVYRGHNYIITHPSVCTSAGDSVHIAKCKYGYCNLLLTEAHTIVYKNKNASFHIRQCSGCTYSSSDSHLYVYNKITGKSVCACGRVNSGGGPGVIEKKPEEAS